MPRFSVVIRKAEDKSLIDNATAKFKPVNDETDEFFLEFEKRLHNLTPSGEKFEKAINISIKACKKKMVYDKKLGGAGFLNICALCLPDESDQPTPVKLIMELKAPGYSKFTSEVTICQTTTAIVVDMDKRADPMVFIVESSQDQVKD